MSIVFGVTVDQDLEKVKWSNGDLTGSEKVLKRVMTGLEFKSTSLVGYERYFTGREILEQAWTVRELLLEEFQPNNVKILKGVVDYPEVEDDPGDGTYLY